MELPVLRTERLILRGHRPSDLAASAAMWAEPSVTRFIGGQPASRAETWARLLRYRGHWDWFGFGYWLVEARDSGLFAGEIGFGEWRRDMTPSIDGLPEAGWAFVPAVHGRGWAREALMAVLAWGDRHLPAPRTVCIIAPDNIASVRLAERCGYVRQADEATNQSQPRLLFARG